MVIPNKIKCLIVSFSGNSEYLASMEVKQTSIPTIETLQLYQFAYKTNRQTYYNRKTQKELNTV
jgi:hypothetical protein